MRTYQTNPLRRVALELGLIERGERNLDSLPVAAYQAICGELMNRDCRTGTHGSRRFSHDGAALVARALLTNAPLQAITFICVSDHVGSVRYTKQNGNFQLTAGEVEMFTRAERLREICRQHGVALQWRLMLADAWGSEIFNDRVLPGALDAYCTMMTSECARRGLSSLRWTTFMSDNQTLYEAAMLEADALTTDHMVDWEANIGEIAHDKIADKSRARDKARDHIKMRAAEGRVLVQALGAMLVLSTESRSLQRYDNSLVPRSDYPGHDYMPKYPHQLK